jgi:hypothetical protein
MHVVHEYGRRVLVLPPLTVRLLAPFFVRSLPHRGRVLRVVGRSRGPVVRDWYGRY